MILPLTFHALFIHLLHSSITAKQHDSWTIHYGVMSKLTEYINVFADPHLTINEDSSGHNYGRNMEGQLSVIW